jgi:hypothetical protein
LKHKNEKKEENLLAASENRAKRDQEPHAKCVVATNTETMNCASRLCTIKTKIKKSNC